MDAPESYETSSQTDFSAIGWHLVIDSTETASRRILSFGSS